MLDFQEQNLMVRIILEQSPKENVVLSLSELKSIFYKKKAYCRLDNKLLGWEIKLKTLKKDYL